MATHGSASSCSSSSVPRIDTDAASLRRRSSSVSLHSSRPPTPAHKLAETAVGVREVARDIGRARVRCEDPRTLMIVTKIWDPELVALTREIATWLIDHVVATADGDTVTVYVDAQIRTHPSFDHAALEALSPRYAEQIRFWTPELCAMAPEQIDLVITLGGDGTVLYTSWLFQTLVPPVIPFHLGSLGFLTVFDFARYKHLLKQVFERGVRVTMRMRFTCTVFRARDSMGRAVATALPGVCAETSAAKFMEQHAQAGKNDKCDSAITAPPMSEPPLSPLSAQFEPILEETRRMSQSLGDLENDIYGATRHRRFNETQFMHNGALITTETFQVLNEVVVDRGPSAYMSQLELFGDNRHLTTVQADGLVVSTPTGSTAYSLSAGGSIVHPEVSAILVTPICPHTLSFRPMLLPDAMELKVCVPPTSRNTAWTSFDGRHRIELRQGDFVAITASRYPFPTICVADASSDWFCSLARCLNWNERTVQKAFSRSPPRPQPTPATAFATPSVSRAARPEPDSVESAVQRPAAQPGDADLPPEPTSTLLAAAATAAAQADGLVDVVDEEGCTTAGRAWDVREMVRGRDPTPALILPGERAMSAPGSISHQPPAANHDDETSSSERQRPRGGFDADSAIRRLSISESAGIDHEHPPPNNHQHARL